LYLCGAVGTVANLAAVYFIFTGAWNPDLFPTLTEWNTWMVVITALSVVIGVTIYMISLRTRRGRTEDELAAEEVTATPGPREPTA
jgi:hypothetical protein